MTQITIIRVASNGELYHQYPSQNEPQPCYVELDCRDQTLTADWNSEIGNAVPADVWLGHTLRWRVPVLNADAANALMDTIRPQAKRIVEGYESEWNGNNHVGTFTEDAETAMSEIEEMCERTHNNHPEPIVSWEAQEWLYHSSNEELKITADTTDSELDEIADKIRDDARNEDVDLLFGLDEELQRRRREGA
jgi:hypothetical protein